MSSIANALGGALARLGGTVGSSLAGAGMDALRGAQRVLEVVEPGPLGGRLGRWEHAKQAAAEEAVRQAVERFVQLQAAQEHQGQAERVQEQQRHPEQQQDQEGQQQPQEPHGQPGEQAHQHGLMAAQQQQQHTGQPGHG